MSDQGECQGVQSFFDYEGPEQESDIIANPPYGDVLNSFVRHAVEMMVAGKVGRVAMLMNSIVMHGFEDADRVFWREDVRPSKIFFFTRRIPMMHRDGWDGKKASSSTNHVWMLWERDHKGPSVPEFMDWAELLEIDPKTYRETA